GIFGTGETHVVADSFLRDSTQEAGFPGGFNSLDAVASRRCLSRTLPVGAGPRYDIEVEATTTAVSATRGGESVSRRWLSWSAASIAALAFSFLARVARWKRKMAKLRCSQHSKSCSVAATRHS